MNRQFSFMLVLVLAAVLIFACTAKNTTPATTANSGNSAAPPASSNTDEKWPDNEFTQQLPKPPFTVSSSSTYASGGFIATCREATYTDMAAYVETLKNSGFTNDESGRVRAAEITWSAKNAKGYKVSVNFNDGNYDFATIQVAKP